MADETEQQRAPSAPPMVAPVAAAEAKPKRRRRASGNGTGRRGGRKPLTPEQKEEARLAREAAERERAEAQAKGAEARQQMARLAAIGALTPNLLTTDEISGLSKFVLAMLQRAPE